MVAVGAEYPVAYREIIIDQPIIVSVAALYAEFSPMFSSIILYMVDCQKFPILLMTAGASIGVSTVVTYHLFSEFSFIFLLVPLDLIWVLLIPLLDKSIASCFIVFEPFLGSDIGLLGLGQRGTIVFGGTGYFWSGCFGHTAIVA